MEKFLLINNYTNYSYDDDDLTSNVFVIGDFDSIEKCIDACEDELVSQAQENASCMDLEGDAFQEYVDRYVEGRTDNEITDDDFHRVGANRYIFDHWYNGGNYRVENQFMVVRIS